LTSSPCVLALTFCLACTAFAQQGAAPASSQEPSHPELSHRPVPGPGASQGKIKIDVVVIDEAGQPVAGLTQQDFTLFDHKTPRPILSFRAVNGVLGEGVAEPPVEVILLLDATNTRVEAVGYERDQVEQFLRRNGGRLMQPTSLMIFDDQDVKGRLRPTRDGNQLADELKRAGATTHSVPLTAQTESDRVTMSLNALKRIMGTAKANAGRTMLIWVGAGWPMLEDPRYQFSKQDYAFFFDRVVTISGELRESRVTLYSIYPTDPSAELGIQHYRNFLRAAPSVDQVRPGNLALPVLAIHSGGQVLDAPADLGDEIASCIAEAKFYYTLGFDPMNAKRVDEYHELVVRVDRPGLKARTVAGYYGEPAFQSSLPVLNESH
jgi:VWFA-related protein